MSIHGYCKKTWRVLLVSLMLVFSLNIVAAAADSDEYQSQVIWDLANITEYLDIICISLETYLPVIQRSLNDISTTVESYFDMLAVMQSSLESIETDASSIVSKLTTIASNLTYNNKSVAYYANVTNNNLLSRTTKILDFQEAAAADLATVITKLSSVDTDLDSVIESLSALNDNIFTVWTEVVTVNTNLGGVKDKLDSVNTYLGSAVSKLNSVDGSLSTLISAQHSTNVYLSNIEALLSYNEKSAAHLIGMMNNNMIYNFNDLFVYQEAAAADLATMIDKLTTANSSLSTITTKITSADSRLGTVVTKITSVDTNIASALFYDGTSVASLVREMGVNMGLQHTLLQNDLGEANIHLSNLHSDLFIWLMNDQVGLLSKLNLLVEKQETANTSLSNIESLLFYNEKSAAHLIGLMNNNMIYRFNDLFAYQEAAAADLATVIDKLTTANTSLSTISTEISSADDRLSTVVTKVTAMDTNLSSVVTKITSVDSRLNTANTNLTTMISNQSELLTLLQEDGVFTTDISGILTDLDSVLSNQSTLVTSLAGVSTNLGTVVTEITSADDRLSTVVAKATNLDTNLVTVINNQTYATNFLRTMSSNLSNLLTLLQQDGAFTTDISGVLTNQQKLIELLEDLELTTNVTIENIENITIDVTNKAYEVFYITDSEGNEQNLADFSGDVLTISGRLLNFFFKVAFDDAMDSVDSALDDMTEFYLDDSVVVGGSSLWE